MMSLRRFKTVAALAGVALMFSGVAACSSNDAEETPPATAGADPADTLVGILMPTRSLERWNKDGDNLEGLLKEIGYQTSLQYADNKVDTQISQIQNLINDSADVLVIASIDGEALGPVLAEAKAQDITIIAYDRLLNNTPDIDYYATFDNYGVGQMQGKFIEEALGLADGAGPFNIEPFAGSPDDNNAKLFFAGAWDVLLPYVESGMLVCPSGKAPASNDGWQAIGIQGWTSEAAQNEMTTRLNSFYADGTKLDVVLSPNDSLALGIAQALEGAGYVPGDGYPVLTGQDGDQANVNNILAGKQSMTVWKDTRTLAEQTAKMVEQVVTGATVDVNVDPAVDPTYNNGVKDVPTFLIPPVVVTADNVEEQLVGSGFYAASDLDL